MKLSPLVYLDTSFIIDVYETVTNTQVPVSVSKSEDISANLSAGFISGGASTTETKEFPLSSYRMFEQIRTHLDDFPTIDILTTPYAQLPDYFWTRGVFGASSTESSRGNQILHRESFFSLYSELKEHRKHIVLVTNDVYLATGYDQVQKHLAGSCQGFCIAVQGLFKMLAHDMMNAPICAPLVMIKEGNV